MEISVNQQVQVLPDNCTIEQLLISLLPQVQKGIAVAINQQIIPKSDWPLHQLNPNDSVMLIKATPGG